MERTARFVSAKHVIVSVAPIRQLAEGAAVFGGLEIDQTFVNHGIRLIDHLKHHRFEKVWHIGLVEAVFEQMWQLLSRLHGVPFVVWLTELKSPDPTQFLAVPMTIKRRIRPIVELLHYGIEIIGVRARIVRQHSELLQQLGARTGEIDSR